MSLRERLAFLSQVRSDFEHTGALQPSSRYLARAMAAPLRRFRSGQDDVPLRILEIGPGTGAVTRALAACMGDSDTLECYEINPRFAAYLRQAIARQPAFARRAGQITVHTRAAQRLDAGARFDFAACSAPLNNFDGATIESILTAAFGALAEGGSLTLFEYALFPALRRLLAHGDGRRRLSTAQAVKRRWLSAHGRGSTLVLRNLPPARVHELGKL